jgi:PPM family protein phosphatase
MTAPGRGLGPIVVSACGRTHVGRVRSENQDRLLVADLTRGAADGGTGDETSRGSSVGPLRFELGGEGAILLVADGMGGRTGGARASALAVTSVGDDMRDGHGRGPERASREFVVRLRTALEGANRVIREESDRNERYRGMGTTATLAGILGDRVYLAQVGDSRAYLVRADEAVRLTRDQSLVQDMIDSGVLSEDDALSVRNNMILQALGVASTVRPEVTFHDLRREDVLLLCSDGLSQVVRDDEIATIVAGAADCAAACDQLVALANERGGPDNVTVLVARVCGEGLGRPEQGDRLARRAYDFDAE